MFSMVQRTNKIWSIFFQPSVDFIEISHFVGNKANRQISKRMLQESKARQIFRKTIISYPLIGTALLPYYRQSTRVRVL